MPAAEGNTVEYNPKQWFYDQKPCQARQFSLIQRFQQTWHHHQISSQKYHEQRSAKRR